MGLFSFTQEIAIDLGTANTVIIHNDKIVVDEPSVVALDKRTDKLLAVGEKARLMYEKTHENIRTIRPLRDGVIADFYAAEQMIRGMVKMVSSKSHWFSPSLRMVIGIPSGSTEVEIRAVRDSSEHAGGAYGCCHRYRSRRVGSRGQHDCRYRWRYDRNRRDFAGRYRVEQFDTGSR